MDTVPVETDEITVREPTKGEVPFYKEHGKTHPRSVKGRFRTLKWWALAILLGWWHFAPFLRWDRGPGAPDQAILIDMAGRRAYFFDIEIWPQEIYYITGILALSAVTLFLMSALAGRVWCGFLCWQTVYTDLFIWIESKI
ncbi:MAG TPA: 4Fe-4S binding protein, partial [Candidatus Omnitrophota bacterium]|nr:4Fe-4S binding protein [Candidatus Omnitrophota bacterium]